MVARTNAANNHQQSIICIDWPSCTNFRCLVVRYRQQRIRVSEYTLAELDGVRGPRKGGLNTNTEWIMRNIDGFHSISREIIAGMAREAAHNQRKRVHLLLHAGHDDQVQRLLIVMQPGAYVRPHHHSLQWEMLVLLKGRGELLKFREDGALVGRIEMSAEVPVVEIPVGAWHGFVVREADTAVLEVKPGPYRPNEFADWAPPEGDLRVPEFMRSIVG
jgi:cupin fold WbuC family metalloprotein